LVCPKAAHHLGVEATDYLNNGSYLISLWCLLRTKLWESPSSKVSNILNVVIDSGGDAILANLRFKHWHYLWGTKKWL